MKLDLDRLRDAVAGTAAAFRCITDYQPAGGPGDKVFPPTYEGGKYAMEERIDPGTGKVRHCVLLDSVQSQANRMELALLEAHQANKLALPLVVTHFDQDMLLKKFTVSSLEAPHRIADALFRDSLLDGDIFRQTETGRVLDAADIRNATGLFGLCPTALVFGLWDSTGPRGGLGAKFQRALVSEIVGYDAVPGVKTSSRIDPAQIRLGAGPLYERKSEDSQTPAWTLDRASAAVEKSKPKLFGKKPETRGKPSAAVHGNITPSVADGGFTVSKAVQTTTLSLAVLRRLHFPLDQTAGSNRGVDLAARTALASLGLAAGAFARGDVDLRSRCQLFADNEPVWELLDHPGQTPEQFEFGANAGIVLAREAIEEAKRSGLPWMEEPIELTPSAELVELIRRSQELASEPGADQE